MRIGALSETLAGERRGTDTGERRGTDTGERRGTDTGKRRGTNTGERRVAMTPQSAREIQKLGHECVIQSGAGVGAGFADEEYAEAGARVAQTAASVINESDVIIKVRPPSADTLKQFKPGQTLISFFDTASAANALKEAEGGANPPKAAKPEANPLKIAAEGGVNVIAMEMIPRISRAQKMDALSSMANIAGYRAVIEAGSHFGRFFTGQITAAGKVPPARVLVIGAGVAGLAAIGTAQALGAVVRAFDVRPEVAEQIESMGAEFLFLDFDDAGQGGANAGQDGANAGQDGANAGQDGASRGGYAAPSSPEFRAKQLALFAKEAPETDIVITTALIPNRDAPELWTPDMVASMKPGSVIVDLAAERGGNCKLTVADAMITTDNGVIIIGYTDFPSRMAAQASTLYATNIRHMLADLTPHKDGVLVHDMEDDVIRGATVAYGGAVTYPPPPPKVQAIAAQAAAKPPSETAAEKAATEAAAMARAGRRQIGLLAGGAAVMAFIGLYAPVSFMQHFIVFVLAVFVGFQVIWGVAHALHTPLMAVTNAISGIIIVGALLQLNTGHGVVTALAAISVLIATINIVGGFMVTRRMLQMFKKS